MHDVTYPSDRLYADGQTFLANVLLGVCFSSAPDIIGAISHPQDDQYESLEIPYISIETFNIERVDEGQMRVTLSLNKPPRLGKDLIKVKDRSSDRGLKATFILSTGHANRLSQALDSRGLVCMR